MLNESLPEVTREEAACTNTKQAPVEGVRTVHDR
jgi:hypothetical protein